MLPIICVIVANHNYGQWVVKAVNSARIQSYDNNKIHIVVADDGSSDDSVAKLRNSFQFLHPDSKDFPLVHVLELDNNPEIDKRLGRGPSYARNMAIKYAEENIMPEAYIILDADDEFLEDKVKLSVETWMEDREAIGVVYSDYYIVDQQGNINPEYKPCFDYEMLVKNNIVHSCSLISAAAIKTCGMYDETLRTCEDYDLWCRVGQKYVIKHIPKFLMNVRNTGLNSTFTVPSATWNSNLLEVRKRYDPSLYTQN